MKKRKNRYRPVQHAGCSGIFDIQSAMLLDNICMRCHLMDGISKNGRWVWSLKKASRPILRIVWKYFQREVRWI